MERIYKTYRGGLYWIRLILFILITLFETLFVIYLLSGKLDKYFALNETTKAIIGGFFGLSTTISIAVFANLLFKKDNYRNLYEEVLKEIEQKYSIYNEELENQKAEITQRLNSKDEIINALLKEKLIKIETELIELQDEKYLELKNIFERKSKEKTATNKSIAASGADTAQHQQQ